MERLTDFNNDVRTENLGVCPSSTSRFNHRSVVENGGGRKKTQSPEFGETVNSVSNKLNDDDRKLRVKDISSAVQEKFKLPGQSDLAFKRIGNPSGLYDYCNEFNPDDQDSQHRLDFKRVIKAVDNMKHYGETPTSIKLAFLVGESCFTSFAPALSGQCDMILMVDHDPELLKLQLKRVELIRKCESIKDEKEFDKKIDCIFGVGKDDDYKSNLKDYHPFSTDKRLSEVRKAIDAMEIVPVCCDLFDESAIKSLSDILKKKKAEVNVINLSNAMEYYGTYISKNGFSFKDGRLLPYKYIKKHLPICDKALCAFSSFIPGAWQHRICDLASYWEEISKVSIIHHVLTLPGNTSFLKLLTTHISEAEKCDDYFEKERRVYKCAGILMHANASQVREVADGLSALEECVKSSKKIPLKFKDEIMTWTKETINFWENENES